MNLRDRFETKRMALAVVRTEGSARIEQTFVERVLPGDMWRHFVVIPEASKEWWDLLVSGVRELWGSHSLVHSGLPPVHRLCGWLVEQDRREEAAALMTHVAAHPVPLPRATDPGTGAVRLDVPDGLVDLSTVAPEALALHPHES